MIKITAIANRRMVLLIVNAVIVEACTRTSAEIRLRSVGK